MNPYQALMTAGQQQQGRPAHQQPQAMPVHHEGQPSYERLEQAIAEIDQTMNQLPLGDPTYDDLVSMRARMMQKRANINAKHDEWVGRKKGMDVQNKGYGILSDPGLESLERGVIPQGR